MADEDRNLAWRNDPGPDPRGGLAGIGNFAKDILWEKGVGGISRAMGMAPQVQQQPVGVPTSDVKKESLSHFTPEQWQKIRDPQFARLNQDFFKLKPEEQKARYDNFVYQQPKPKKQVGSTQQNRRKTDVLPTQPQQPQGMNMQEGIPTTGYEDRPIIQGAGSVGPGNAVQYDPTNAGITNELSRRSFMDNQPQQGLPKGGVQQLNGSQVGMAGMTGGQGGGWNRVMPGQNPSLGHIQNTIDVINNEMGAMTFPNADKKLEFYTHALTNALSAGSGMAQHEIAGKYGIEQANIKAASDLATTKEAIKPGMASAAASGINALTGRGELELKKKTSEEGYIPPGTGITATTAGLAHIISTLPAAGIMPGTQAYNDAVNSATIALGNSHKQQPGIPETQQSKPTWEQFSSAAKQKGSKMSSKALRDYYNTTYGK